jgi:hypothetical protein
VPIAILDVGGMDLHGHQMPHGVGDDVAFSAFDLLPASYPRGPPLSVVLADWLSTTPADGLASRPTRSRACCNSRKLIVSHRPAACQA